jgi:hypothetical protein
MGRAQIKNHESDTAWPWLGRHTLSHPQGMSASSTRQRTLHSSHALAYGTDMQAGSGVSRSMLSGLGGFTVQVVYENTSVVSPVSGVSPCRRPLYMQECRSITEVNGGLPSSAWRGGLAVTSTESDSREGFPRGHFTFSCWLHM